MSEKNPHRDSAIESLLRDDDARAFYLNELRSARNAALADAEGFMAVIHTLELMGQKLTGTVLNFRDYQTKLNCVAGLSLLSRKIVSEWPEYHTKFGILYEELRHARNDAVHQGASARILTDHAVDITIILEDALMSKSSEVSQFMVRDVVEAKPWHPVSYVRQQILKHGFSYLPIWFKNEEKWKLISDYSVARYLPRCLQTNERKTRLVTTIEDAIKEDNGNDRLRVLSAKAVYPEKKINDNDILKCVGAKPVLVVNYGREDVLAGILTSSDIL
ncbi:MAG: hypothetical protein OXC18_24935 [Desulfurellaceae bacterium]|nr:hypothetical protein [Desulfurellaceae bacterium]